MIYLVLLIAIFLFVVFVLKPYVKPQDTIELWVGTNGSGKTLNAVKSALRCWKRNKLKVKFYNLFHKDKIDEPVIISSVPIMYKGRIISYELTKEHLTGSARLPLYCVVVLDEISLWLPQLDFKNKNINACDDMATLFRHYCRGNLILTTQDISKVAFPYRYCTGSAFVCSDFRKHWWAFFKIGSNSIRRISINGDIQAIEIGQKEDNEERIYNFLTKHYDTYAFSERYKDVPNVDLVRHTSLKVKKVLRCPKYELPTFIERE